MDMAKFNQQNETFVKAQPRASNIWKECVQIIMKLGRSLSLAISAFEEVKKLSDMASR